MKKSCSDPNQIIASAEDYPPSFCAQRLKVLAEPNCFAILKTLLGGSKYVWQLIEAIPLEQSLLSHHLKPQFRFPPVNLVNFCFEFLSYHSA